MVLRWAGKFVVLLALALSFQNCHRLSFQDSNSSSSNVGATVDGHGHPYDGKPYVVIGNVCADGTFVDSRIVLKTAFSGTLLRRNCQNVTPLELGPSDFKIDPADSEKLIYANQTFVAETPAVFLKPLSSWYYQLTGPLKSVSANIYDVDMFDNDTATIQSLQSSGHTVICNISAGTFEASRPDAGSFSASDLGNNVTGGGAERWIDTRSANVRSIMLARLDLAKSKGCTGVDLDSVDGYGNNTGFPLNATTQIDYNSFLAYAAHDRKLIVALKNAEGLVDNLVGAFDFAIAEQCFQYNECGKYQPFISQGKAVLVAEHTSSNAQQCSDAKASSLSLIYVSSALDGSSYETCP